MLIDADKTTCNSIFKVLFVSKTKELVLDLRKQKTTTAQINVVGTELKFFLNYEYIGVHINDKLG